MATMSLRKLYSGAQKYAVELRGKKGHTLHLPRRSPISVPSVALQFRTRADARITSAHHTGTIWAGMKLRAHISYSRLYYVIKPFSLLNQWGWH